MLHLSKILNVETSKATTERFFQNKFKINEWIRLLGWLRRLCENRQLLQVLLSGQVVAQRGLGGAHDSAEVTAEMKTWFIWEICDDTANITLSMVFSLFASLISFQQGKQIGSGVSTSGRATAFCLGRPGSILGTNIGCFKFRIAVSHGVSGFFLIMCTRMVNTHPYASYFLSFTNVKFINCDLIMSKK